MGWSAEIDFGPVSDVAWELITGEPRTAPVVISDEDGVFDITSSPRAED